MRILVYGLSGLRGGVESFIENYCLAMNGIDPSMEFEFIVIDKVPAHAKRLQDRGFAFHVVPNRIPNLHKNRQALRRIIADGHYDCLWYNVCTLSDITAIEEAAGRIPAIALHAHNSQNMGNAANLILHTIHKRKAAHLSDALLSCSLDASRFMFPSKAIHEQRHRIVLNGIDVQSFQFNPQSRSDAREEFNWENETVYVTLGRLSKQKNPLFVLDIFAEIRKMQPDAHLAFIGNGDMRKEVERKIEGLGLNESVDLLGTRQDAARVLSGADVFLFPSLFEGFGMALVEAQAAGLPCLASSDVIPQSAFLTDHAFSLPLDKSPKYWAQAALRIKPRDPEQRKRSANIVADKGFDIHDCAKKMIALFDEMTETTAPKK